MSGEQVAQGPSVDPPAAQGGVEAAPAPAVRGRQAQVDRRGDRTSGEKRIGQIEERVGSLIEASVERAAEGVQRIEGLGRGVHDDPSCPGRSPMSTTDPNPWPFGLKGKLRATRAWT